ncbi:hypothetical protein [Actinoplanes sichuanensis]|uniref:Uncharacterized protein n=1 Tax=Actinoplanes sichuanensis TaxID=512349 RepID=A0ABW4A4G0_9ACTN
MVAVVRERGRQIRADFAERELPDRIDPSHHGGRPAMLHLDLSTLAEPDRG